MAKTDLELRPDEHIIHSGLMSYVRNKMHIQGGSACLTNQRFIRFQQNAIFVILLKTTDGTEYKLICKKFDAWMVAFQTAYEGFPNFKLFMVGAQQWAVQAAQGS